MYIILNRIYYKNNNNIHSCSFLKSLTVNIIRLNYNTIQIFIRLGKPTYIITYNIRPYRILFQEPLGIIEIHCGVQFHNRVDSTTFIHII